MARVLSGIQPSGKLHIGNYLGALKQWVELQDRHEALFCIVDLHAITVPYEPKELERHTIDTALDLLAIGLDPKKVTLFIQSQVHEHAELAWLLTTLTPLGELERMTQFKEKSGKGARANVRVGLLSYPVLMAADILLYKATVVPVGEDQIQHLELARKLARKFNHRFGEVFPEPNPYLKKPIRVMSLTDPSRKMSKSDGEKSYIALADAPDVIMKKVKAMPTATSGGGTMSPGVENLFSLMAEFTNPRVVKGFMEQENAGTIKYAEAKETLGKAIAEELAPFRERREESAKKKGLLADVLGEGARKAQKIASETLEEVKDAMGLL
jgi:tryptophanyl-tRNA synthetase